MAEYSWGFTAPASPIKITKGTNTNTYTGIQIPFGGYSYTVSDFNENDEVTISAVGYNKVTVSVGEITIIMTEMPEVEVLNPNGTNYAIADAKARQQVADLETNIYNDLQNYATTDTAQTIRGYKTISNDGSGKNRQMDVICENLDLNNLPSSSVWGGIEFHDVNDTRIGKLEPSIRPDGTVVLILSASQPVNGTMKYASFSVSIKPDGTAIYDFPNTAGYSTYKSGATISSNADYTVPNNGVIAGEISAAQSGSVKVNIGGVTVEQVGSESSQRCRGPFYAIVKKGQVVKLVTSGNATVTLAKFYAFS